MTKKISFCKNQLLLLLLTLAFVICNPSGTLAQPSGAIKIGVASMITPIDAVKYYQDVIDYIGEQIGRPVQMVHRKTYDEMDSLLEKRPLHEMRNLPVSTLPLRKMTGDSLMPLPVP